MRAVPLLCLVLMLGACVKPAELAAPALHDLGPSGSTAPLVLKLPLRKIEVQPPIWLNTPAMQYRLAYQQSSRRYAYADNRWAAPPAQLLETRLARRIALGTGAARCKLTVRLDEFVQVFDSASASRVLIAGEWILVGERVQDTVARQSFEIALPSASPDSAGGVAALAQASDRLAEMAQRWLNGLDTAACRA